MNSEDTIFTDTSAVLVYNEAVLGAMLQDKWAGMKTFLINGDPDQALTYVYESSKEDYAKIFNILSKNTANIAYGMQDIELIYAEDRIAKYRIKRQETIQGQNYDMTYYIYFIKDRKGLWRIERF